MWIEIILIWKYSDKALLAESISVNYLSFLFTCLLFFFNSCGYIEVSKGKENIHIK